MPNGWVWMFSLRCRAVGIWAAHGSNRNTPAWDSTVRKYWLTGRQLPPGLKWGTFVIKSGNLLRPHDGLLHDPRAIGYIDGLVDGLAPGYLAVLAPYRVGAATGDEDGVSYPARTTAAAPSSACRPAVSMPC